MRDNHDGMLEIIAAFEQDGHYFALVQLERDGKQKLFRFGVDRKGYLALKRVLQLRPFDQIPGIKYRYFYDHSALRLDTNDYTIIRVRVEQGRDGKLLESEAPRSLDANLRWFSQLKDWSQEWEGPTNASIANCLQMTVVRPATALRR